MIKIFIFLLIVLLLGAGFAWVAERPGQVLLEWQGDQFQTSLMVVVAAIVTLVAFVMILWWLTRTIIDSPAILHRYWRNRKKDRGYHALSRGLIAANSGDAITARQLTKQSTKLLGGKEPLVGLLEAQTSLLEGREEVARERFEDMLEDDETRLVALRGLFAEAERQGASEAARHYAAEAHKAAPTLAWAGKAELRFACQDGDWEKALATLESNRNAGLVNKEDAKRKRAVLLTAYAMVEEPADPTKAARMARDAHKLAPDFVPAAVIAAKALSRNNDIGRAAGILEAVWKKSPHPEIAQSYVHLRVGDSALDRLKRARKLSGIRPNHSEGSIAIAEAAIEAHEWREAREAMKAVMATRPTERACLLMSEIEEGEYGDRGRVRDWLARAVRAPRDAAWTADGYISEKWLPISPLTGELDAFEWKVPVEALEASDAKVLDSEGLDELLAEQPTAPIAPEDSGLAPGTTSGSTKETSEDDDAPKRLSDFEDAFVIEGDDKPKSIESSGVEQVASDESGEVQRGWEKSMSGATGNTAGQDEAASSGQKNAKDAASGDASSGGDDAILKHRPDDPGIRESDRKVEESKRFGLF